MAFIRNEKSSSRTIRSPLDNKKQIRSQSASDLEGGARERADDVFFCRRHKKASEQSGLCSDLAYVDKKDTR